MNVKSPHVPIWQTFYASLSNATKEQTKFYRYWLKEFERDNFIDIQDNYSYLFVFAAAPGHLLKNQPGSF